MLLNKENKNIPLVAIRDVVVFPNTLVSFDVGRLKSILAIEQSVSNDSMIFLVSQKDSKSNDANVDDLYNMGVICKISQITKINSSMIRVIAEGIGRANISKVIQEEPYIEIEVLCLEDEECEDEESDKLVSVAHRAFEQISSITGKYTTESIMRVLETKKIGKLSDILSSYIIAEKEEKQAILEILNPVERLNLVVENMYKNLEVIKLQEEIIKKVKTNIDKHQRDYYLREQIKVVQEELGEKEVGKFETNQYREKISKKVMQEYVKEKLDKEIKKLERGGSSSTDTAMTIDYIENILELEWNDKSEEQRDLKKAENILNSEHYGLSKVKERIVEFLAVRQVSSEFNSPILCLTGPPGVGKTSIVKSIAKALNRKYVRISLGGVRDEAEIRGHRRTYLGAIPGRIIYAMKQAKTVNPLILLDEIDKMSSDARGNPSSAMLEVLDGEQNKTFRDSYLEIAYDLSDVLFVCTANDIDTMPNALRDRLEIINLSSYTLDEKVHIASDFLIEKNLIKHGFSKYKIKIEPNVIEEIIEGYTKEAGVRQLERSIAKIFRKILKESIINKIDLEIVDRIEVTVDDVEKYLGKRKFKKGILNESHEFGIVKGLAWTSVGGDTLSIEVNIVNGTGKIELTGNMGDIMKESAKAGLSYIRSNAEKFKLKKKFYLENDIHIHIPNGAVPKDGPSAGITMATAMVSAFTKVRVKRDVAMTGEITIRGRVIAIGGLKEKVIAAKSIGIKTVIIPKENESDLIELDDEIKEGLKFVLVKSMDEVLEEALVDDQYKN